MLFPCHHSALLRQCLVLHESLCGRRKYPFYSLIDHPFCGVLLPLFTIMGIDCCDQDVIIACGPYLLEEEEK
jgi:hypothetical protein